MKLPPQPSTYRIDLPKDQKNQNKKMRNITRDIESDIRAEKKKASKRK